MSLLDSLEIYIPLEAEVRRVPLLSLPRSVLRKMAPEAPDPPEDPDHCVWICPALFQKKGQKRDQNGARQHMLTVLGGGRRGSSHWKMSFVTANTTAYRVLKGTLPLGPQTQACSSPSVPQGSLSNREQDAVIIHHGRIYLSVKRRAQGGPQGPPQTADSQVEPPIQPQLQDKPQTPEAPEGPRVSLRARGDTQTPRSPRATLGQEEGPKDTTGAAPGAAFRITSGATTESIVLDPEEENMDLDFDPHPCLSPDPYMDLQEPGSASSAPGSASSAPGSASSAPGSASSAPGSSISAPISSFLAPGSSLSPFSSSFSVPGSSSFPTFSSSFLAPGPSLSAPGSSHSEQEQDFNFQELKSRERIALMKAALRKN